MCVGKLIASVFLDSKGIILVSYLKKGKGIGSSGGREPAAHAETFVFPAGKFFVSVGWGESFSSPLHSSFAAPARYPEAGIAEH